MGVVHGMQVTEDLLEVVGNVRQLEALHIGHMRVQGERLGGLAQQSSLRELTIHGEELTNGSLSALGSLTQLTALGMTTCYQARSPTALCSPSRADLPDAVLASTGLQKPLLRVVQFSVDAPCLACRSVHRLHWAC